MDTVIGFAFENFGLCMLILALIIIFIQSKMDIVTPFSEIAFRWIVLLPFGVTGIYSFIMHAFWGDLTAASIGWANSPFQYEVAMANLGFGTLGILAFWMPFGFRLATVIGATLWLWGDAIGHMYQIHTQHNYTPGNAGSWFWLDILIPVLLIVLLWRTTRVSV